MKELIKNNLGMKILSVFIAILVWLLVSFSNDPLVTRRFANIRVSIINGDKLTESGKTYSVESGDTVDIIVKGNQSVVNRLSKSDFRAVADLSQLTEWKTAAIHVTPLRYADQLEINLGSIQVVSVSLEDISQKSLKVVVNTTGEPAAGYVVGPASSAPSLIDVEGPQSKVEKINAIAVSVNVSGERNEITEKFKTDDFQILDEKGEEITADQLSFAQKSLKAKVRILKEKELDIKLEAVGTPAEGYCLASLEYEPKKITVIGEKEDLKGLNSITLDTVSVNGLRKDYTDEIELTDEFLRAETGRNLSLYQNDVDAISIKAIIEKEVTKTLPVKIEDIEVNNNTEDYKVSLKPGEQYAVTVSGAASVVKRLKLEYLRPSINMESIRLSGDNVREEHTMKFHYVEPEYINVTSVPETVVIIVSN